MVFSLSAAMAGGESLIGLCRVGEIKIPQQPWLACPGEDPTVANADGNASSRGGWLAFSMLPKAAVLQAIAAMKFNQPRPGCNLLNTEAVHHTCLIDA
jgi:hypothetical protein